MAAPDGQLRPVRLLAVLVHGGEIEEAVRTLDDLRVDLRLLLSVAQHPGLTELVDDVAAVGELFV